MKLLALLLIPILAGCASPEEIAQNQARYDAQQRYAMQSLVDNFKQQCRSYGFTDQMSQGHTNCMNDLMRRYRADQAQAQAAYEQQEANRRQALLCATGDPRACPGYRPPTRTICRPQVNGSVVCDTQ